MKILQHATFLMYNMYCNTFNTFLKQKIELFSETSAPRKSQTGIKIRIRIHSLLKQVN